MILNLNKNKKLSFYRKTEIYIGEKDFDEIQVLLPPEVDGNEISDLLLKLHLVNNKGEYTHIALSKKIDGEVMVGSTMIAADLTNIAQDFFIYIEMIKGDNEVIGKTNVLKITINPLPDEKNRIIPKEEYEETIDELTEIIERNTEAMNRINGFEDGKSAYEIAVEHGYEGTEEEWLNSLKGANGKSAYQIAVDNGYQGTEQEWLASLKGVNGDDGISPTVTTSSVEGGTRVVITDRNGEHLFTVSNGAKGDKGDKGDTGAAGAQGEQGVKGDPGATGADGFSPTATVTQTASGATVSITDKNGTTTANISNGADGQDYVLTSQDKTDIANIVLGELPTTQGVLYGNTSN